MRERVAVQAIAKPAVYGTRQTCGPLVAHTTQGVDATVRPEEYTQ